MGLKARLSSYCTKRANNGVNLVTSRKINTRLARPITAKTDIILTLIGTSSVCHIEELPIDIYVFKMLSSVTGTVKNNVKTTQGSNSKLMRHETTLWI